MEFLLQLFADMIGEPEENQAGLHEKITKSDAGLQGAHVIQEQIEEKPVLFGLMQFH